MNFYDVNYIVVHCSATKSSLDIGYDEIDQMHKDRGWRKCGYHFIIRLDGTIEIGRNLNEQGAHVGGVGHNHDSWGICLIGGLNEDGEPTDTFNTAQRFSLEKIIRGLLYKAPDAEVLGHRDLSPDLDGDGVVEPHEWLKQCPCFDVRGWWRSVQWS